MAAPAPQRRDAPARRPAPASRRAPLEVVDPRRDRARARRGGRSARLLTCSLVVGSLLAVAGAQAYLTQGQVRLTRLQQSLQTQLAQERQLEIQVANLQNPTHIVSQAQNDGMVAPQQVGDLPQVSVSGSPASPASQPAVGTSGPGPSSTTPVVSPAPATSTPATSTPATSIPATSIPVTSTPAPKR